MASASTCYTPVNLRQPWLRRGLGLVMEGGLLTLHLIRFMPGSPAVLPTLPHRQEETVNDYICHCETKTTLQIF